ncbi:type IV pilin protein [Acinetobacter chinensis]|jgi:type IV pilus assembly protein PilE|uniref:type IV pilin protein n=1 Tax=Acinetobacter chinensis TaxID=2004650 RepID=UPI002934D25D|nr:type IV pilin protein [Acinetobacter chinensis]WOE41304.1 type IV pilin protein [Acinetobacter chinensis]
MVSRIRGFTLLELMIVVAIIGILAAIAYPSYREYVRQTHRAEMQTGLQQMAAQIQKYKISNFKVKGASASDLGVTENYPANGDALYTVELGWLNSAGTLEKTATLGSEKWVLTATPVTTAGQYMDGHLVLNFRGERCWEKASDKGGGQACTPTASSSWNSR